MNSKKTKKMVETMHDEAIARCERTAERRTEVGDRRSEGLIREALQAEVNRLHAERGETVLRAKASRLTWGLESDQFKMDWMQVEAITVKIAEVEKALEDAAPESFEKTVCDVALHLCLGIELLPASPMQTACSVLAAELHDKLRQLANVEVLDGVSRGDAEGAEKAWRDPAVDLPDDDMTVLLRLAGDVDDPLAFGHHEQNDWSVCGASPLSLGVDVIGWMHMHEATAILDKATRSAARGEVAHG